MENKVEIIHLSPEEWEDYKNLRLESLKEDGQVFGQSYEDASQQSEKEWKRRLVDAETGKSWSVFARADGELIGMIQAAIHSDEPDKVWLHAAYVDKKAREKGIGKRLMEKILEEISQSHPLKKIKLTVNKGQVAAIELYKKFGFEITGEQDFTMGNGEEVKELVMEKQSQVE